MLQIRYEIQRKGKVLLARLRASGLELRLWERCKSAQTYGICPEKSGLKSFYEVLDDVINNRSGFAYAKRIALMGGVQCLSEKNLLIQIESGDKKGWLILKILRKPWNELFQMDLRVEEALNIFGEADKL